MVLKMCENIFNKSILHWWACQIMPVLKTGKNYVSIIIYGLRLYPAILDIITLIMYFLF